MMYRLLKNNVECHPDAIAIVTSDLVKHSYTAVHKKVHQWANYFLQHGIGVGDRVAVLLDNEDHHLFIFLALDRINACYVPFDTDIPKQQLSADILTLDLKKFIIEEVLVPDFNVDPSIQLILSLEKLAHINAYDNHEPVQTYNENADEKTSYILASSGSTGHKNWIPILGSGLLYWARVKKEQFGDSPVRNILITRSPAYDARIAEYICAFSMGGTLHFLNRRQRKDILSIIKACEKPPIDCLLFIASQLTNDQVEKNLSDLQCHGLKHLMVTGDACTPFLKQVCEQLNIKLWNCYGPTEATLGLSMLCVNNLPLIQGTVPIGPPFGNEVHYHLLENNILCIESPYLTEGYLNTSSGNSPFQWIVTERGKIRVFNTGDLFYEQDGLLCYQGRASFESHCKINGVKVTPLIIEQCIHEYTNGTPNEPIQAAVVIKNYLGRLKPFAYLVINPDFNQSLFLIYLKGRLKKEEFPILVCIDELPRLYPSQKIDRKKLIAQQDNPDHFFFNQGQGYRKKFSNDGQGINEERLIAITLKLSDFHSIELMSYQEVATLLNEAVLCSNYIDQQNDQYNFAPMQREQRVLSLLENAYQTLITIYPCIDFFTQEIPSLQKLFALPFPILSATAQLLHYFGKALRYRHPDHAIDIRIKMFETSIAIVQFLDEHVEESARAEVDPNYFTARQLTYNLPIIYMLRQKGNFQHAIEKCQEQLKLAHSDDNQFHVIQALVQLSESYAASQQFELAFEHASAAFKLTDNEAGKYSILYFNAITRLMLAAHQKQDLPLAMQLAQSVVAITQISCIALKTHHLQAAKKILSGTNDHRLQAVEKIWQELFQYDNIPHDTEFMFLGGDSLMATKMLHKINAALDKTYSYTTLLALPKITIQTITESICKKSPPLTERAFIQQLIFKKESKNNIFFFPALLGTGNFRHLAERMSTKFDSNIYGLSDPGITDETSLPKDLAYAVHRYLLAIKSVQVTGPYELLGFSFGATLVSAAARTLLEQGEKIKDLHLVDGLPPYFYQALSRNTHVDVLKELLNFVINTLRERYSEALQPITLTNFGKLEKQQQIELSFAAIEKKITKPESKRLLYMAKRHLTFILMAETPQQKLPINPTFYLTDRKQEYLQAINKLPGLSKQSADYHYFFWNRYFYNITRGPELDTDHLTVLRPGPAKHNQSAEFFWRPPEVRPFARILGKVLVSAPPLFYRLEPLQATNNEYRLSIFFINRKHVLSIIQGLKKLHLSPKIIAHEKNTCQHNEKDMFYTDQANIFCVIPYEKIDQVKNLMSVLQITRSEQEKSICADPQNELTDTQEGTIDLIVYGFGNKQLTLSFKFKSIPEMIIQQLHQKLNINPIDLQQEKNNISYLHVMLIGQDVYDALEKAKDFFADFVSVIVRHLPEEIPEVNGGENNTDLARKNRTLC